MISEIFVRRNHKPRTSVYLTHPCGAHLYIDGAFHHRCYHNYGSLIVEIAIVKLKKVS